MRVYGLYRETKDLKEGGDEGPYTVKSFMNKKEKIDLNIFLRLN